MEKARTDDVGTGFARFLYLVLVLSCLVARQEVGDRVGELVEPLRLIEEQGPAAKEEQNEEDADDRAEEDAPAPRIQLAGLSIAKRVTIVF